MSQATGIARKMDCFCLSYPSPTHAHFSHTSIICIIRAGRSISTGRVQCSTPKNGFRLPLQALLVRKFEFRPPQGSFEEVDLRRRARARGGGGGGGACEHGRCVHRRPPINMATRCLWSQCIFFRNHVRPHSSTASRCHPARLLRRRCNPRPSRSIIRCGKAGAARGLPFAALCPPPL